MLSLPRLSQLRGKALRMGVWFQSLTNSERAIVELTVRYVNKIRSCLLSRTLNRIVEKLVGVTRFTYQLERFGRPAAVLVSQIAERWGNHQAKKWSDDPGFVEFHGLQALSQRFASSLLGGMKIGER